MQPDQPTSAHCPARYERVGGRLPGDRIVHCHLEAGHPGEHEEADTEVTWLPDALDDHERFREQVLADPGRREAYLKARVDAAYQRGLAEGDAERAELRGALEETRLLLEQAEQYARDLQHDGVLTEEAREQGIAEGRRQAADAIARQIRRELVCCDVYDRDQGTDRAGRTHAICFWGEAGARLAEEAARLVGPWEPAPTINAELTVAEPAEQPDLVVPCDNEREPDGDRCTGEIRYMPGDAQAACGTCGGWRGRFAPATGGMVDSAPAPKWRRDDFCGPEHTYRDSCVYALGKPEDGGR